MHMVVTGSITFSAVIDLIREIFHKVPPLLTASGSSTPDTTSLAHSLSTNDIGIATSWCSRQRSLRKRCARSSITRTSPRASPISRARRWRQRTSNERSCAMPWRVSSWLPRAIKTRSVLIRVRTTSMSMWAALGLLHSYRTVPRCHMVLVCWDRDNHAQSSAQGLCSRTPDLYSTHETIQQGTRSASASYEEGMSEHKVNSSRRCLW